MEWPFCRGPRERKVIRLKISSAVSKTLTLKMPKSICKVIFYLTRDTKLGGGNAGHVFAAR